MNKDMITQTTRNIILEELKKIPDKDIKVLDLECGRGELTTQLKRLGFNVYAADIAPNPFKKDIPYKRFDFNDGLDYPDNFFDIVISMEVIERIENPWFFMEEVYRITKSDGKAIITTPNVENYVSRWPYLLLGRFVSFGPDLGYWQHKKENVKDKHRTPIFHFMFKEMIYHKFTIEKHISNGVLPIIDKDIHWRNPNVGISKTYILKRA